MITHSSDSVRETTNARPLTNASAFWAGQVENWPGQVDFVLKYKGHLFSGECSRNLVSHTVIHMRLHRRHLFKLLDKMYKYETDPTRTLGMDGWTDGRTDEQTRTVWNQYIGGGGCNYGITLISYECSDISNLFYLNYFPKSLFRLTIKKNHLRVCGKCFHVMWKATFIMMKVIFELKS